MYKIYCHKNTNEVAQIFPYEEGFIDIWDDYHEGTFPTDYLIELDVEEIDFDYSYRYNQETKSFEKNPDYIEYENIVEPSVVEELQNQINLLQMMRLPAQQEVEILRQENETLKSELDMIKRHLGLS